MTGRNDCSTERLSALLDGDLPEADRPETEAHLAGCSRCGRILDEMREIRRRARELEHSVPTEDLWSGIESRLGEDPLRPSVIPLRTPAVEHPARGGTRVRITVPQALAASLVLLVGGWGAGTLMATGGGSAGAGEVPAGAVRPVSLGTPGIPGSLSSELAELEAVVQERASALDEGTRRRLLGSLETIDRAIRESLDALAEDPGSEYLQGHLGAALERKRGYLRQVSLLLEA